MNTIHLVQKQATSNASANVNDRLGLYRSFVFDRNDKYILVRLAFSSLFDLSSKNIR